jgi:acyl carrier protein
MTQSTPWIVQLLSVPLSERSFLLETFVDGEFRNWLQMTATELLPHDESYFALGLTSLGAVEIQECLEVALDCKIDSSTLYNNPTIGHLVSYLRNDPLARIFAGGQAIQNKVVKSSAAADTPVPDNTDIKSKQLLKDVLDALYD